MDSSLNGERAVLTSNIATGVRREGTELMLNLPGGGVAYLEVVKLPPEEVGLFPAPWKRISFGDGITLLVRPVG
jgi:hypothetical protein